MLNIIETESLTLPELQMYSIASEVRLLRYCEPEPGIFIAESPRVISRALDAGYTPVSMLVEKKQLEKAVSERTAPKKTEPGKVRSEKIEEEKPGEQLRDILGRCGHIPIYAADEEVLARITGFKLTRGALCAMRRRRLPEVEPVCSGASRIAVLEDIMNQTNVGAVFRSAAALGFDAVLLTPGCCDPLYRRSVRVSMGTVFQIPWTFLEREVEKRGTDGAGSPADVAGETYVAKLKSLGFATAAMALCDDSVGIDDPRLMREERLAVILGTEGEGLRDSTIKACDYTVKIPMARGVDSLNAAAAGAVAFWQLGRR